MNIYAEQILEHYRRPHAKGHLLSPTITHREVNWSCGDDITIELILESGNVRQVAWQGTGCAISQAAMSMLTAEIIGQSVDALLVLSTQKVFDLLGVPVGVRRQKCALLGLFTLQNALLLYRGESLKRWEEIIMLASSSRQSALADAN